MSLLPAGACFDNSPLAPSQCADIWHLSRILCDVRKTCKHPRLLLFSGSGLQQQSSVMLCIYASSSSFENGFTHEKTVSKLCPDQWLESIYIVICECLSHSFSERSIKPRLPSPLLLCNILPQQLVNKRLSANSFFVCLCQPRMVVELHRKVSSLIEYLKQKWAYQDQRIVSFNTS